jgi:hypothetical protein
MSDCPDCKLAETNPPEEWRAIPGFEAFYEVSSAGRVRSKDRIRSNGRVWLGRDMKISVTSRGRRTVGLNANRSQRHVFVHRLVLLAFVGPCPQDQEACHNNGDPGDNRLENLRWDTKLSNMADRDSHGRTQRGETHHSAKLTMARVREIRASGLGSAEAAMRFGLSQSHAYRILNLQSRVDA